MQLTHDQLAQFERDGYLILKHFAEPEHCDTIRDIAIAHLKHKVPPIETEFEYVHKSKEERERTSGTGVPRFEKEVSIRRLRQVYDRDIVFREWMEDASMQPILGEILGDTPVLTLAHHNSIMTKMPHTSTETRWHQDFRYWHFENDNLVSVWLALDSENDANGVLEFIPGSHRMVFDPERFDEKEYFDETLEANRELIATKVSNPLEKGDVLLFHCKLLHRANRNTTDKPKISFVYTAKARSNHALPGTRSSEFREIELGE
jgi:phytanoyl-CoA hydroxylase